MNENVQDSVKKKPLLSCEGNCMETHGGHKGDVLSVVVSGNGLKDYTFIYCENAINEDISRGFFVKPAF